MAATKKKRAKRSEFEHLYKPPTQVVVFHEHDRDLDTIVIQLPSPPPLHTIEGYGKHPSDQYFIRTELPPKLASLNDKGWLDVEAYWEEVAIHWDYYKDEMAFIDQEWERRKNGYWFYNNGVPTWITGHHYMHLTYFQAENKESQSKYQSYRDRDRRFYTAVWWCKNTTMAPFKYRITDDKKQVSYTSNQKRYDEPKKKGFKVEEQGYNIDMGMRTVIGMTWNKMRREGATTKACNINLDIATRTPNGNNGMQSATEDHAEKIFKTILLRGWRGYPFYFKPINTNNPDPSKDIQFKPQSKKGKTGGKDKIKSALYSKITYRASTENAYDSEEIDFIHVDECGKTKEVDVERRHMKFIKQTLTLGANKMINGLCLCTTTVGDMEKDGAEKWKKLCQMSHHRDRNDNGQTQSGLVNFFIDSADGLQGFIDKHGNSLFEEAAENITAQIEQFIENDDMSGLIDFKKDVPRCFRDCFSTLTGNKRFPMHLINERLQQFTFIKNPALAYYRIEYNTIHSREHKWDITLLPKMEEIFSGKAWVILEPCDESDADVEVSYIPDKSELNKFYTDVKGKIHPANCHLFSQGADMFKFGEQTSSGKGSNGAIAVFRKYQPGIDPPDKRRNEINPETGDFFHQTGRFSLIYNKIPPTVDEFCEKSLMISILFGCKCYPETNITDVWRWYSRRKFDNYLQFKIDMKTFKESKAPGEHTGTNVINSLFNSMRDYLLLSALIENHLILLQQCSDIDIKMNDFDVFSACGFALLGANEIYKLAGEKKVRDISKLFQKQKIL